MTFQSYLKPPALPRVLTVVEMRVWPPQAFVPLFQPFHAATAVSNMCGTTMNACTQLLKNLGSFFYDAWRPITIHAPREGSDAGSASESTEAPAFLSTLPARGATWAEAAAAARERPFLSTLPARGATGVQQGVVGAQVLISIHAPREGSDGVLMYPPSRQKISIHAPREGSDGLSAHPTHAAAHFYPRSPRGERPHAPSKPFPQSGISIHAPREGSDLSTAAAPKPPPSNFYPRSPRGERLEAAVKAFGYPDFYPRSPRGERRLGRRPKRRWTPHFYPRSPRGERHLLAHPMQWTDGFLSTLPARGATSADSFF